MQAWEAIQRVVDYIEEHLEEESGTEALAGIAGLSEFYFQRLFKRLVGRTVGEYRKLRRLARSCEVLGDRERRILDVALEYGFRSHQGYTKAFKKAYGITPEEYRRRPVGLRHFLKPELVLNYVLADEGVPVITEEIVLEVNRKKLEKPENYVGISGQVPVEQAQAGEYTAVCRPAQIWDEFHEKKKEILCGAWAGIELGASMPGDMENGTFTYFAGVEVDERVMRECKGQPWELPAGEYIVCRFEAESVRKLREEALDKVIKYLFGTWLPAHKMMTQPFSAEKYYEDDMGIPYMELWVLPEVQ